MGVRASAGLILGAIAWVVDQQLTSELTYARCDVVNPFVVLTVGLACAGIAAVGILFSWSASRASDGASMTSFTATLGILSGAFSFMVVAAGTVAGFLVPGCFR